MTSQQAVERPREVVTDAGRTVLVFDPTGTVASTAMRLAERKASLAGTVLGVVDNGMPGVENVLRRLADRLVTDCGFSRVAWRKKPSMSSPAPREVLDELIRDCSAVLVGAGV